MRVVTPFDPSSAQTCLDEIKRLKTICNTREGAACVAGNEQAVRSWRLRRINALYQQLARIRKTQHD